MKQMPPNAKKAGIFSASAILAAAIVFHFAMPFEGEKFKAYPDGAGVWTICRGHTKDIHQGMTATQQQCDQWYKEDIDVAQAIYNDFVRTDLPPNVQAAAVDFIFNAGAGNFRKSTLLRKLNAKDIQGACDQFQHWYKSGGKDCRNKANGCYGIVTRREKERELCLDKMDYSSYVLDADNVFVGVRSAQAN